MRADSGGGEVLSPAVRSGDLVAGVIWALYGNLMINDSFSHPLMSLCLAVAKIHWAGLESLQAQIKNL